MSDLMIESQLSDSKDCPLFSSKPTLEKLTTHIAHIGGGLTIRRALPHPERRMIGAWCFFDHFGPLNLRVSGLNIAPHPHIGLQTFTWTIAGEILHRDSLGSEQIIRPGAVNLMTAGRGIAHSEESLPDSILHGVQLWIALPDAVRHDAPEFHHYAEMPTHELEGVLITLLVGDLFGKRAPTKTYSPLVGLNLQALDDSTISLPVDPSFEYGVLLLMGEVQVEGENLDKDTLLYLGCGRKELKLTLSKDTQVFIIGGKPFEEEILLWWNLVARTKEEIIKAATDWENKVGFGEVIGYDGDRLNAPALP